MYITNDIEKIHGRFVTAVDLGVIPCGAIPYFPEFRGYFFASDTRATMCMENGRNIDLLVPTIEEAREFDKRNVKVELIDLSTD